MSVIITQIESLLFISNQPLSVKKLASVTKSDAKKVEVAVKELTEDYNKRNGGVMIQRSGDKVQMVTGANSSKVVKDYIKEETTGDLTKASLETLTIIAYRGPVSRAELEQIRGVNCAVILRNLAMRGLIDSAQDKKKMTTLYNITMDFLKFLGLTQQSDLPNYEKLHSHEAIQKILDQSTENKNK